MSENFKVCSREVLTTGFRGGATGSLTLATRCRCEAASAVPAGRTRLPRKRDINATLRPSGAACRCGALLTAAVRQRKVTTFGPGPPAVFQSSLEAGDPRHSPVDPSADASPLPSPLTQPSQR